MQDIRIKLQPKQREGMKLIRDYPVFFYGGAKGGGKSYFTRAWLVRMALKYPGSRSLLIRKTFPELNENHIQKFWVEYPGLRQYYNKQEKTIYIPITNLETGVTITSSIRFSYLANEEDVYNYQGLEYDFIAIDEITQHDEQTFKILRTSNRTTNPMIKPRMLLTGNPGGKGHHWVKRIFIDKEYLPEENEHPEDFGFLQAFVWDNPILLDNDPQYLRTLQGLPEHLRRAYLEGDWDVIAGQFFSEWRRPKHIPTPFPLLETWEKMLFIDYGRTNPFACYWIAIDYEGTVIVYRELYQKGVDARPNALEIIKQSLKDPVNPETGTRYSTVIIDRQVKQKHGHLNSAGEPMTIKDIIENTPGWKATMPNLTTGGGDRVGRFAIMHEYLRWDDQHPPKLVFFPWCKNAIRTIPTLQIDKNRIEDLDTDSEDHAADALSMGLAHLHERKTKTPLTPTERRLKELRESMTPQYNPNEFYRLA